MNLFINYYIDRDLSRDRELRICLQKNLENPLITKVYLMMSRILDVPHAEDYGDKLHLVLIDAERPTYSQIFDEVETTIPPGELVIIANSDIYFDNSLHYAKSLKSKEVAALSRYDIVKGRSVPFHRADSQDVWIYRAGNAMHEIDADFTMGQPGCDNKIALLMEQHGFEPINCCYTISAYHLHETGLRRYTAKDRLKPPYKLLPPRSL